MNKDNLVCEFCDGGVGEVEYGDGICDECMEKYFTE
jgi:hypothetical protein